MEKNELRAKIYSKVDELPTLSMVLPKLMSLVESDKSSASDITSVISRDPALTSKILKVANSAYYGFQQKVLDLNRAVALLGSNMVRSLALSIKVVHSLPSGKKSPHFSREGLWIHSLAVATAMQELGKRFGKGDNKGHLFIIGLLHDIGKIVLDQFFSELFQQALEETRNLGKAELYMAERRTIGFDHGEVGAMLLTRWKFPDMIINPIAAHHQTEIPEETGVNDVAMLRIANILPQELGLGEEGNPVPPEINEADLEILGMKEKELEDMRAYLNSVKDGIYDLFSAMS
ncbi:MAG: HDOD domain-containing protein [Thermodesulfobacteriota bacterium]|nr:HDOD domain-containing protein [Thermodesulfobacteriota bacterium]